MRLSRLTLERYGPFERLELSLDPAPGRVNLIVAPNGFGKSVIRGAVGELLFGIPERSAMAFQHGTDRMRLLAEIDGGPSVVRRKGRGNTLALADGEAVPPATWQRLLGGADETVFRELFGLDTALLRAGGAELIRSQGRLGQVLFAAGGGLGRVRELLARLEARRDELGRVNRHKSRPIWAAMDEWQQASAELRRVALRPEGWARLEAEARAADERLEALRGEQEALLAERERLGRIGAVRPWLARLDAAERDMARAGGTPLLDATFETRWRAALERRATALSLAGVAEATLAQAQAARADLSFDAAWIEASPVIEALAERRGVAVGAERDLPGVRAAVSEAEARAASLRRDLGWGPDVAVPAASALRAAQAHLQLHARIQAEANAAGRALEEAEAALAAVTQDDEVLPDATDVAGLADLLALLRAQGDPAARLDAARRRVREADAALAAAIAAIPGWRTDAVLAQTVTPAETMLEHAERRLTSAEAALAQIRRDTAARLAQQSEAAARLARLETTAQLPPPEALAAARAERDRLWAALSAGLQPDPAGAIALDRSIRAADAVADALIAHGREVAEATALRHQIAELRAALEANATAAMVASEALEASRADSRALGRAAGGDGSQEDAISLRQFLRARGAAVARLLARDAAAGELADLEVWLDRLGARLAAGLGALPGPVEAIGALLAAADRRVEVARDMAARRAGLTQRLTDARRQHATRLAQATEARAAQARWMLQWQALAAAASRPTEEPPETALDALGMANALRVAESEVAAQQRRVREMEAALAELASGVARLSALAPELATLAPLAAAAALQRRAMLEREGAARCRDADHRLEASRQAAEQSRAEAAAATLGVEALRAALRVEDDDAAERQLLLVAEAARARDSRDEAQRNLAELGGGLTVSDLRSRAEASTAEDDATRLQQIEARRPELAEAIEAAREVRGVTAAALERASAGTEAADAAQRRQSAQAALARSAEEALMLHAAQALLQAALDRQAALVDQPLLARIGTVFRDITGGVQAGVAIVESKAGQKVMEALEADGIGRKSLDQLSEGTADQLYLALRIAALEDYASTTPPLPFVADDVLQTSDDTRTVAALRALLALSAQVQVIALTHHPHVAALGAALPAGALHVIMPAQD